ncbi:MAG: hypothetical protein JWL77_1706 [Chthonomonadaceae bacterium]|nr:hypothetical protein [Chthonomonadaceae bacterium]
MRLKRRTWQVMIATGMICLAVVGSALFQREPVLLERATKVVDVKPWWTPAPILGEYRWISDTVVCNGSGKKLSFLYKDALWTIPTD